jgi:hypothetical protein
MLSGKEGAFAARRSGLPGDLLRPLDDDPFFGIPRDHSCFMIPSRSSQQYKRA